MSTIVISRIEAVSIHWYEEQAAGRLEQFFDEAERRQVCMLPARSAAGMLAAKRAAAAILEQAAQGDKTGVSLEYHRHGSPAVVVPRRLRSRLRLSVAHTGATAYGLAVLTEGGVSDGE